MIDTIEIYVPHTVFAFLPLVPCDFNDFENQKKNKIKNVKITGDQRTKSAESLTALEQDAISHMLNKNVVAMILKDWSQVVPSTTPASCTKPTQMRGCARMFLDVRG